MINSIHSKPTTVQKHDTSKSVADTGDDGPLPDPYGSILSSV